MLAIKCLIAAELCIVHIDIKSKSDFIQKVENAKKLCMKHLMELQRIEEVTSAFKNFARVNNTLWQRFLILFMKEDRYSLLRSAAAISKCVWSYFDISAQIQPTPESIIDRQFQDLLQDTNELVADNTA